MNQPKKPRARKSFDLKSFLITLLCLGPVAATLVWTALPSLRAAMAITKFSQLDLNGTDLNDDDQTLTVKRQLQRHFLDYSVYIPIEDIVMIGQGDKRQPRMESLMTKVCGRGSLFVWVPFKIALPFYGEKVFEWCWKPKLRLEK